jgi:hypothetical protein
MLNNQNTPDILTADEAAKALRKSRAWVYRHASALGAYQPYTGCALSFPASVIIAIKEGRYALSNEGRKMARPQNDNGCEEDENFCYESVGKTMGGRTKTRRMGQGARYDPYNLLT